MLLYGVARRRAARGDTELAVDRGQVPVHCARADDQLLGYLGIGQSSCHQAQYLDLSCRQAVMIEG